MPRSLLLLLFLLFSGGCSFKSPPNAWQYKSTQSFESYKQNFLKGNDFLAAHDLKKAIKEAKSSSDLSQLASVYLGKCALNKAVGLTDNCKEFQKLQTLVPSKKVLHYYLFLQKDFTRLDPALLPSRYENFAKALKNKDIEQANETLQKMKDPTSMMLALSLLGKNTTKKSIETALQKASFYGYKKGVLHLLREIEKREEDPNKKAVLKKKIEILKM